MEPAPALITDKPEIEYQGFLARLVAYIIDILIMAPLGLIVIFNSYHFNIPFISDACTALALTYTLYFQTKMGATPGKSRVHIKIVSNTLNKPVFTQIVVRNIFYIAGALVSFVSTINATFFSAGSTVTQTVTVGEATPIYQYSGGYNFAGEVTHYLSIIINLVIIIDVLFIFFDKHKRALHDIMAGTFVIKDADSAPGMEA